MDPVEYIGKFHPLAVHLPIGILSGFLAIAVFIPRGRLIDALPIVKLLLLISALSATLSSVTGFLLSDTGEYDMQLVTGHRVLGIALTVFNWGLFFGMKEMLNLRLSVYRIILFLVLIIMMLTGHAGGSLTHGSDFLIPPSPDTWFSEDRKEENHIDMNTNAYEAVSVILKEKCYSCHGKSKQKGKLRLDVKEGLDAGGKSGGVINDEKLLVKRILLPKGDEDRMPPKEKKQLSEEEIKFLTWWVTGGADFNHSLGELNLPDSLYGILTAEEIQVENAMMPNEKTDPASGEILEELRQLGITIMPLGADCNYLSASFINVDEENISPAVAALADVQKQLIDLNLDYKSLKPEGWNSIGLLTNLRKFSAKSTNLSDENISALRHLPELVSLNFVGTDISSDGLLKIRNLDKLRFLFLFQTAIDSGDYAMIREAFPSAEPNFGNYLVPTFRSDTTVYKK